MDRRQFLNRLGLVATAGGMPWLSACAPPPPLGVAIHPWVGYETLYIARELSWLPDSIQLLEGKTLGDSRAALKSGQADAACLTLDEMLHARADGLPLSVALVFDVSAGADMVLAREDIASPADLRGKRLGFEQNALGALVLQRLLEAADLPASALTLLDLPPDRQLAAWRAHEVDAVITYEPAATLLMKAGARKLFDSRRMPDTIFDVLAVRRDRVGDARRIQPLVASHFRALAHMRRNAEDALFRIAAHQGVSADEARLAMAGVTLPSLAANRGYLQGGDSHLSHSARALSALMARHKLLAREDDLRDLVLPGTLPSEEG